MNLPAGLLLKLGGAIAAVLALVAVWFSSLRSAKREGIQVQVGADAAAKLKTAGEILAEHAADDALKAKLEEQTKAAIAEIQKSAAVEAKANPSPAKLEEELDAMDVKLKSLERIP